MTEERAQRRLAAILAADVVGYSQLMEQDEAGTLAALKVRRRDVLEPLVGRHQGRIFKTTGDGVLVEFASAVNAVQCAVDLQHGMAAANDGVPEDRRVVLRVGVNLGDVVVEGSDHYGDGVNLAARLQELAEPSGVCVSAKVREEVGRKREFTFEDFGERQLKNITSPVRTYIVRLSPSQPVTASRPLPLPDKPSIAILPFVNMSGDPEQEYFSDGVTEDIITDLSKVSGLFAIARNSSFAANAISEPPYGAPDVDPTATQEFHRSPPFREEGSDNHRDDDGHPKFHIRIRFGQPSTANAPATNKRPTAARNRILPMCAFRVSEGGA